MTLLLWRFLGYSASYTFVRASANTVGPPRCVGLEIMSVSDYHWPTREVSHGFVDLASELNDSPLRFEHRAPGRMNPGDLPCICSWQARWTHAWRSSNYLGDWTDSFQTSLSICMPSWLHGEVLKKLLPSLILRRDSTAREQI